MTKDVEGEDHPAVRIPADVDVEDKVLGPLTARQTLGFAVLAVAVWGGWLLARPWIAPLPYAALVVPVAALAAAILLGRRDGVRLDQFLRAGLRHMRAPKRLAPASDPGAGSMAATGLPGWLDADWARQAGPAPAPLRLPAGEVTGHGAVDLGEQGHATLAACSTVNFALRTAHEQAALTAAFGRWLNSLTRPTQLLIRAQRMDLGPYLERLCDRAPALPHPALERSAYAHASFVHALAEDRELLVRQVLLVQREKGRPHAHSGHGLTDAARGLGAAGVTVTALDGPRAREVIAVAADPDQPSPRTGLGAPAGATVTGPPLPTAVRP